MTKLSNQGKEGQEHSRQARGAEKRGTMKSKRDRIKGKAQSVAEKGKIKEQRRAAGLTRGLKLKELQICGSSLQI